MDWDKLRIFHAVAKAGSFTHAGKTLNLSQSAISRQVSSLEDSLENALFHRHARGLISLNTARPSTKPPTTCFTNLPWSKRKLPKTKNYRPAHLK